MGGVERSPAEAYAAFDDALHILKGLWGSGGRGFSYTGTVYSVQGAQFGPAPVGRLPVWVGAAGPKMLRLTGRLADGVWVSSSYEPPARLLEINQRIDEGAAEAGRDPAAIRRGYNLMGIIDYGQLGGRPAGLQDGILYGTPGEWVTLLTDYAQTYSMDTFNFWGMGDAPDAQLEAFIDAVVPGVRAALR
jgi:alkanesulfonate monooxygenase SsuD/methylene tetrahydromethanopterin reductase-like flavin-dependent oxidoreductase (luciferase family)